MKYVVGIPTRDRPEMLEHVVWAFLHQTVPPDQIIVVNNNSRGPVQCSQPRVLVIPDGYPVLGPEQGHQTVLALVEQLGYEIAVRWDDDLVPELGCMEVLLWHLGRMEVGAVGGCYPRPQEDWPIWEGGPKSGTLPPDGHPGRVQFFRWCKPGDMVPDAVPVRHLYSGMMYLVSRAVEVGGFCTLYSQLGFRAETDFSMRVGNCKVDPAAIALHYSAKGGVRSFTSDDYATMARHDEALFERRMKERGLVLDGRYWE